MSGTGVGNCSGEKLPEVALTGREQQRQEQYVYPPTIQGLNCSPPCSRLLCVRFSYAYAVAMPARVASVTLRGDKILWNCRDGQLGVAVRAI